jgi:hypothetical protein
MTAARKPVKVTFERSPPEALALAQFVKQSLFQTYREFSADDEEAYLMFAAVERLRQGHSQPHRRVFFAFAASRNDLPSRSRSASGCTRERLTSTQG